MTTSKGPTTSMGISVHGAFGSWVIPKGSGVGMVPRVAAWHEMHFLIFS